MENINLSRPCCEGEATMAWNWKLIMLSYLISVIGSYTTLQAIAQANRTSHKLLHQWWYLLATLSFGGVAIWCMHFIGMMAMDIGIPIRYHIILTGMFVEWFMRVFNYLSALYVSLLALIHSLLLLFYCGLEMITDNNNILIVL